MIQSPKTQPTENDRGIAESLGPILLIAVIALGIGVFTVALLSQQAAPVLPSITFNVTYGNDGSVAIRHLGGDSIPRDQLRIYIDDGAAVHDIRALSTNGDGAGWTAWGIGDILVYTPPASSPGATGAPPKAEVLMVYSDRSGGDYLVHVSEGWRGRVPVPTTKPESFIDFVIDENVFVYGNVLRFSGDSVYGPGATVIITGGLDTADTNLGASIAVSDIYFDGDVALNHGSAGLGSTEEPGSIYVNGNLELWSGAREIYGDVYVNGNFRLKDARIHGNVYVDGDLTLGWTPWIADDARIYYTGGITTPDYYNAGILAKCIHRATVPGFKMPDKDLPAVKSADWYAARGYVSGGALTSNMKVFADSYTSTSWRPTATNVVIIARTGDITITGMGGSGVTGVFFAPNGKVTFNGEFFEGVVIARDGFFVTSGGTDVTFRNIEEYISNPNDYPF
ncbi:type IV pilin [Methanoculleus sp. Wushi-C6]|uniref:Type IV pilin n=1 Tax=Methanoculleus caldifontis TaxID=2651577 RepID=A0ABU3X3R2_9EURY|nr:type IV pilin N-terminal domain-containing protein [Methanoculleus sp. Wushi-C6]MDV2482696.1 type IV pilin [Methanoculleus sp. Wushi-C6]